MSIKILGIPKQSCSSSDVFNLFQRVAQVKRVQFDRNKGQAKVFFFDKFFEKDILQMDWYINGSKLTLSKYKFEKEIHNCQTTRDVIKYHTNNHSYVSKYDDYKRGISKFWSNILHENSKPVCKTVRKRRRNWEDFTITEESHKRKKKKKVKNEKISSLKATTLEEPFLDASRTTEDELKQQEINSIQHSSKEFSSTIPVYIMHRNKNTLLNLTSTDVLYIKRKIRDMLGIPVRLQVLLHKGKVLDSEPYDTLEPYDNIHIVIRGRGGMINEDFIETEGARAAPEKKDLSCEPNKDSSEEEVTEWMKVHVQLDDKVWEMYEGRLESIDGSLLFSYDEEKVFASDANIPIGVARKILYNRKFTDLLHYQSPGEVKEFIFSIEKLGINGVQKTKLADGIRDNYVDGFNFQFYQNAEEFFDDLKTVEKEQEKKTDSDLKTDDEIPKMCLKKILQKRDKSSKFPHVEQIKNRRKIMKISSEGKISERNVAFEQEEVGKKRKEEKKRFSVTSNQNNTKAGHHKVHDGDNSVRENIVSSENVRKNDDEMNIKEEILKRNLLQKCQAPKETETCEECVLKIIMHKNWNKPNSLEKRLIFFLIAKTNELEDKKYKSKLWRAIVKNKSVWEGKLDDAPDDQQLSTQCVNLLFLMDVFPHSLEEYKSSTFIFLVSCHVINDGGNIYRTPVSSKTDAPFYFTFSENTSYFVFDPRDILESVKEVIIKENNKSHAIEESKHCAGGKKSIDRNPSEELISSEKMEFQVPRKFKADSSSEVYKKGRIFFQPEDDGTLSERCFEFKLFEEAQKFPEKKHVKFKKEVLRFACGCLNRRVNGTIYFGISDQKNKRGYKNGEIVGFHIIEDRKNVQTKYSDELRSGIEKCFFPPEIAKLCISNPFFVRTETLEKEKNIRVVMEVDIEPANDKCENKVFSLNLNFIDQNEKNEHLTYVRHGSSTEALDSKKKELFRSEELQRHIKSRREFEVTHCGIKHETQNKSSKLRRLLTCGDFSQTFDIENSDQKYICRILICSKPTTDLKKNENFERDFSFLRFMHFAAVFDFDELSNEDGLCFHFRNKETSEFVDDKHFQSHLENFRELVSKHNVDRKTIWIFANGRLDFRTPHLQGSEWESQYYREITAAISFFQLPSVIPPNRIMFIFLLLSNEFDGILDTFHDIKGKFGWSPLVIVSNSESTFREFSEQVIKESNGSSVKLEKHSVIGMPWNHVNKTILQLIGKHDTSDRLVLSSSGTPISLSNNFIRSCTDLEFLSLDECENLNQDMDRKSVEELEKKHQLSFYKGTEATWWNFFFSNQVCPRKMYLENIKEKINEELKNKQNETSVVVLTIVHEAGSGATTLARNILWDYRKDKVRCCLLKKITDRTVMQLMQFWRYGEDEANKISNLPIFVLIDGLIHIDYSFFDFIRNLKTEFRKGSDGNGINCLALICQREDPSSFSVENDSENMFTLRHKLNEDEKRWFWAMSKELEEKKQVGGYDPKYLISFMIMRDGFNKKQIHRTFEYLLYNNDVPVCERELIKFVAFLSAYTPSARRLIKVYIPVQCCDTLMGNHWWENNVMSNGFQIVLNIKKTNTFRNERHVEMGYPDVALNVLETIMSKEKVTLAKIAMDFLENFNLKERTHGNELSMYFLPILKERKLKDNYRSRTAFSPLIESILESDFEGAVELLRKSFDIFDDPILAQTLARVYLKRKRFEEAIDWAKQSVSAGISTPTSCSFCLHTYGVVLRDKFNSNKKRQYDMGSETMHLELLLQSLEKFVEAQNKRDPFSKTYEAFHDTIFTINIINNFLTTVNHGLSIDEIRQYLVDKEYIPEKINHPWKIYHEKLKGMKVNGERAMDLIDEIMCFYSSFDVQDSKMNLKHHRLHFDLHKNYIKYLTEFSFFYGQHDDQIDRTLSTIKQDACHRARILALNGRSFKTIFDKVTIIDTEGKKDKEEAMTCLVNIRRHVNSIKEPTTTDLTIKVCVNVALGIVGGQFSREKDLIKICRNILRQKEEKINLACMFLCMLMWPLEERESVYDNEIFNEALNVFRRQRSEQRKKIKDNKSKENTFLVIEKHICQPTITFFQGKIQKKHFVIKSLYHRSKIFLETPNATDATEDLLLMRGIVREDGYRSRYISLENKLGDDIKIFIFRGKYKELRVGEKINFHLGFSIDGPVAYNMRHDEVSF